MIYPALLSLSLLGGTESPTSTASGGAEMVATSVGPGTTHANVSSNSLTRKSQLRGELMAYMPAPSSMPYPTKWTTRYRQRYFWWPTLLRTFRNRIQTSTAPLADCPYLPVPLHRRIIRGLGDRRGVAQHADRTLHLGQVSTWHYCRRLVIDADLEASWAPVDKLNTAFHLNHCDRGIYILGDDVSAIEEATCHVLSVTGITLDHLVCGLEAGVSDLLYCQLLVISLFGGNNRRICGQGEMDSRVWYQICLELCQVHNQSAIKAERGRYWTYCLAYQAVRTGTILFYAILFYSILFYSILFYFCSHPYHSGSGPIC
ncbi:unnamed protein product [Protopolystoma xenopodis]|uniref:Uncharacterized protein n=1 Tax=Protopolystoma xenopodis TaxID=117903 RepID=A0A3S5BST7_9PLAT|nr:unnamed protein product [Protopolystoma xenopodis]